MADKETFMSAVRMAHDAMQAEFNRVAGTDNWRMFDTPKMAEPYFDQLLSILGEGNYRIMAGSSGNVCLSQRPAKRVDPWKRATLLLSPDAEANVRAWNSRDSDTQPKAGDSEAAPLGSGAGPKDIAQ